MEIEFIFANLAEFGESNFCDTPKRFDAVYMTFPSGKFVFAVIDTWCL